MPTLSRRRFLGGVAAATVLPTAGASAARRPNVLVLFPDQLRGQALSIYGEKNIQTAIFDQLLVEGAHFPLAFTPDPVCTPARAAFLTGQHPRTIGVLHNRSALPLPTPTLSSTLSAAGYRTGFIGKWHLNGAGKRQRWVPPERRHGFGYWAAFNVHHRYMHSLWFTDSPTPHRPDPPDTFEPVWEVDLAIRFLEETERDPAPFFLMIGFGPPHPPGSAPVADWSKDVPQAWLDQVDPAALSFAPNVPSWILGPNRGEDGRAPPEPGCRAHMQGYYASLLALEQECGRLLRALSSLGLAEDTIVIFASDHGEMGGAHGLYRKGNPYEESIRVPLGFRWPGRIPADRALPFPASLVDVTPTVLGLTGVPGPAMAGVDLSPWLLGAPTSDAPNAVYIEGNIARKNAWRAVRQGPWTYAEHDGGGPKLLFNSDEDPWQRQNLFPRHRGQAAVKALRKTLAAMAPG